MNNMPMMGQPMMNFQQNMPQNINFQNPISGTTNGTPIDILREDLKQLEEINHDNESVRIKKLVNDINDDLDIESEKSTDKSIKVYSKKKSENNENNENTDTDTDLNIKSKSKKSSKNKKNTGLVDTLFDAVLLFVIYMLMSQHFMKSFIGTYISVINENQDGVVSNFGVAVYGLIFIIIFILSKILVNKME